MVKHIILWKLKDDIADKAREYDCLVGMDAYNIADLRRIVYPEDLPKIHKLLDFAP